MHLPCFTFLVLDPFRSSSSPLVCRSSFHISYVFLFSLCSRYTALALCPVSSFYIIQFSISPSHWFSVVVAYPEPTLELRLSLRSVLYKVTQPLVCSLASSTQSNLVSSLPRFTLRLISLKPSLTQNGSLRTLRLFVRSSLGYSTQCKPHLARDYLRTLLAHQRLLEQHSRHRSDRGLLQRHSWYTTNS